MKLTAAGNTDEVYDIGQYSDTIGLYGKYESRYCFPSRRAQLSAAL